MGLVNPRPAMRGAEERQVRRNLEAHGIRMKELIAQGMSVEEASSQALKDVLAAPPKEKITYVKCECVACGWKGERRPKGVQRPCPKCKCTAVHQV